MILAKTPFRISLVGGGTDMPEFYRASGRGAVVSAAIDRYMYVMIHPYFHDKLRVRYSQVEDVDHIDEIRHPLVRECLRLMEVSSGVEIASIADVPAGLGLGSSSSFTVALLHALHAFVGADVNAEDLAAQACDVEIERAGEPIGKQDQFAASCGGLNYFQFHADGTVSRERLDDDSAAGQHEALWSKLLVFYVGDPRPAGDILRVQREHIQQGAAYDAACRLVELAGQTRAAIQSGRHDDVGSLLDEGWHLKRSLAHSISNPRIETIYAAAKAAGALGGKLLGAGGGGFMLFYCPADRQAAVRAALGLRELKVQCDRRGSRIILAE